MEALPAQMVARTAAIAAAPTGVGAATATRLTPTTTGTTTEARPDMAYRTSEATTQDSTVPVSRIVRRIRISPGIVM